MISIAMTTFNGEKYLKEQVDSILNQTITDFELIICDDCSTDSTFQILQEYTENDSRIKLYQNEKNLGFKKNFEKAISLCSGDYIALSDQDDVWSNTHLELLLNNIENSVLICANAMIIDGKNEKIGYMKQSDFFVPADSDMQFLQLMHCNVAQGCTILFKRELVDKVIPIPDEHKYHDYWIAVVASILGKITYIPDAVVFYRQHECTVTANSNVRFLTRVKNVFSSNLAEHYFNLKCWHSSLSKVHLSDVKTSFFINSIKYFDCFLENHKANAIRYFLKNYKYMYATSSYRLLLVRFLKNFLFYKNSQNISSCLQERVYD